MKDIIIIIIRYIDKKVRIGIIIGLLLSFPFYCWLGLIKIHQNTHEIVSLVRGESKSLFEGSVRISLKDLYDKIPQRASIKVSYDGKSEYLVFKESSSDTTIMIKDHSYKFIFHNTDSSSAKFEILKIK